MGELPKFGPLQSGYDHFHGFRGAALDYCAHQGPGHQDDLWDDDMPIHQVGYRPNCSGGAAPPDDRYRKELS